MAIQRLLPVLQQHICWTKLSVIEDTLIYIDHGEILDESYIAKNVDKFKNQ